MVIKYRPDIDGLRAMAVVPVVLYHAGIAGFGGGFVGVDIFFVISGYLITKIIHGELAEERFSIIKFYERRARRILPALLFVLLSSLVAGWFLLPPESYDSLGRSGLASLFFFSNIWFWQNSGGYFQGATDYLPLLHTWSLAVEEQFYIAFPLFLMMLHRFAKPYIAWATVLLVLGSLALAIWATPNMPSASFYLLPTRIWELGFGCLLALGLGPKFLPRLSREAIAAIGLLAIILPITLYTSNTTFPGLAAVPPVLGAAMVILAGATGPTLVGKFLALRPLVLIGLLSYSLYLWHWPIMSFARNWQSGLELDLPLQIGAIMLSLGSAWLTWRFVERPFRAHGENNYSRRQIFAGSGLGMAMLAGIAAAIILTGGVTQRFSDAQNIAIHNMENPEPVQSRKGCFGVLPMDKLCVFGNNDSAKLPHWILWGDSHAKALLPAFIDLAEKTGNKLVFAAKGGCAPQIGALLSHIAIGESEGCERFKKDVLTKIETSPDIETVIIAARWPPYIEGNFVAGEIDKGFRLAKKQDIGSGTGEIPLSLYSSPSDHNAALVEQALGLILDRITASGKRVILLGTVPEVAWEVTAAMQAHILFDRPLPAPTMESEVKKRQAKTNDLLSRLGQKPNVLFINLAEEMCSKTCPTHDASMAFYGDNNHLTPRGAKRIVSPILTETISNLPDIAPVSEQRNGTPLNPQSQFGDCGKTCPTHYGATAYYTDNNHLTPEGVKLFVAPILEATLKRAPAVKLVPNHAKN